MGLPFGWWQQVWINAGGKGSWGFLDEGSPPDSNPDKTPLYLQIIEHEKLMIEAEPEHALDMARLIVACSTNDLDMPDPASTYQCDILHRRALQMLGLMRENKQAAA